MPHHRLSLALLAAVGALAFAVPGGARPTQTVVLNAVVGPGYNISLTDASGQRVTHLDPGTYTIAVQDKANVHNFHLTGPGGVDQATDIDFVGNATWTVTLVDGTYRYQCDAHPTLMKGSFGVGTASPPPTPPPPPPPPVKPKKLAGSVGPGARIALRSASGARVAKVKAGRYALTVKDASKRDNFHLVGKGVNVKTGVAFTGKKTWTIRLAKGTYSYRSDATPRLKGRVLVG
jgi:hypothetical protein